MNTESIDSTRGQCGDPLQPSRANTVLIVEDNPADLFLLRRAVSQLADGYRFVFAHEGEDVINYLRREGKFADVQIYPYPDLVLMDFRFPKMNGVEVVEWIRQQPSHSHLRVVMWSDSDCAHDFERAIQAGVIRVVRRPLAIQEMRELLREFLHILA